MDNFNLRKYLAEGKLVKEGVWNQPTMDEVVEFVAHIEDMKDKFYHIGSDDVFNGLDQAIMAARDLVDPGGDDSYNSNDYVEDPSNPLGEPGSLNEEYEVGAEVILRGSSTVSDIFTVVGKRRMFGSNLMAYSVEHPNGETMEYDETQLSGVPTTMGDRALRSAQFKDGERMGYKD